jgi:hypothetical protein
VSAERIAPTGAIWVCGACGKTARDRYGIEGDHSRGWDESCMLNAILCNEQKGFTRGGMYSWTPYAPAQPVEEK